MRRFLPARSLRARILLTTAGAVTVIMMAISWGILAQWRQTILAKEQQDAIAVTRAFSVTVIDAMILEGNDLAQSEGFLDNYIAGFMRQNPRLRYIAIAGPGGEKVARSLQGPPAWSELMPPELLPAQAPVTWFRRHDDVGWVQEAYCPLTTGQKRWGGLLVGFEAESVRREIVRVFFVLLGLVVAITGLTILLLWVLLGRLLGSLRDLVGAMDSLDLEGDDLPTLPDRQDEIGVLFRHFQEMRGRLSRSRLDLISAQEQVYHAERLAAIGRLASGVAHELNNPINGVRNCIYAIRHDPENREKNLAYLQMMDQGMEQAASIITKLLGFARKQQPARAPVAMNTVVRTVARLLSFDLERKAVTLESDLQEDLPAVTGDSQLLQEVVMNLLLNAIDAVDTHGHIRVRTRAGDERSVTVEVRDDGKGIAATDLPRIFDPFFTTKPTGEGTGLGLSVSLGIVQTHGGTIGVASDPGTGTTFTVTLPGGGNP
jgi:two-component system, NtrC family, sensor kinase